MFVCVCVCVCVYLHIQYMHSNHSSGQCLPSPVLSNDVGWIAGVIIGSIAFIITGLIVVTVIGIVVVSIKKRKWAPPLNKVKLGEGTSHE